MKNITILGVTGSIGQQTVDVCLHHQDEFNVVAMSAGKNIVLLETTIQKINPQVVCVIDEKDCNYLQEKYLLMAQKSNLLFDLSLSLQ